MLLGISAKTKTVQKKVKIGTRMINKSQKITALSFVSTQKKLMNKHYSVVKYIEGCDDI